MGAIMRKIWNVGLVALATISGCASASSVRMSEREIMVQSTAAPACGTEGAMKAAQKQAAIETIKAGYDRYIIVGTSSSNNVHTDVVPGVANTYGNANFYGNSATFNSTTTYTPMVITSGHFNQGFVVRMFKNGEPGAAQAVSARAVLGPKWADSVKRGVLTCT